MSLKNNWGNSVDNILTSAALEMIPLLLLMPGWKLENQYGDSPQEMTEAIISEWLTAGKDPEPYDSIWFALPDRITSITP
jgi:hypothetical protein